MTRLRNKKLSAQSKWLFSLLLLMQNTLIAADENNKIPADNAITVSTRISNLWTWVKDLWEINPAVPIVSILMLCILSASLYNFFKKETNVKRGIQLILVAAALANIIWLLNTIWKFRL